MFKYIFFLLLFVLPHSVFAQGAEESETTPLQGESEIQDEPEVLYEAEVEPAVEQMEAPEAEETTEPEESRIGTQDDGFEYVPLPASREEIWIGPRFGFTIHPKSVEEFSDNLKSSGLDFMITRDEYRPFLSQFGFSYELRYLLGSSALQFALQSVLILGGLDQNIALPSLATFFGIRAGGLELAVGPNVGLGGFNVVYALGYTFAFSDVYIPVNFTFQAGTEPKEHIYGIFTGLNLRVK